MIYCKDETDEILVDNQRLVAIGDIHGDIVKLNSLLDKLNLSENDTVIFLGDYIDVGENPKAVVDRLLNLSKNIKCIFLKGNHEELFLDVLITKNHNKAEYWFEMGGYTTFESYDGNLFSLPSSHIQFFQNLKLYHLTDSYLFVHGGIRPDKPLNEQKKEDILWIRDNFIYKKHLLKQKVIFGHTPFKNPYIEDDKIGINTGCGYDKNYKLTAIICNEEKFIQSD